MRRAEQITDSILRAAGLGGLEKQDEHSKASMLSLVNEVLDRHADHHFGLGVLYLSDCLGSWDADILQLRENAKSWIAKAEAKDLPEDEVDDDE